LLAKDAKAMSDTLSDPTQVGHLIVSIPEEMPLIESLELRSHILRILPRSEIALCLNRLFPAPSAGATNYPDDRPFAITAHEHASRKAKFEAENLEAWKGETHLTIPFFPPTLDNAFKHTVERIRASLTAELGGPT